jgi:hypothetical protein
MNLASSLCKADTERKDTGQQEPALSLPKPRARKVATAQPVKIPMNAYPTLNTVVRLIAQRGFYQARKHDGELGARTILLGMQEITVFVKGPVMPGSATMRGLLIMRWLLIAFSPPKIKQPHKLTGIMLCCLD